jgi:hypothetical protein
MQYNVTLCTSQAPNSHMYTKHGSKCIKMDYNIKNGLKMLHINISYKMVNMYVHTYHFLYPFIHQQDTWLVVNNATMDTGLQTFLCM